MNSWHLLAGVLALAAVVTAALTVVSPWWVITSAPNAAITFYLTDSLRISSLSPIEQVSLSFESLQMVWIQLLYTCVLALVLVALVLSLVAGVLSVLAAVGRVRQPYWGRFVRTFLVVGLVVALAATIAGATAQPTAFSREKSSAFNLCSVTSGGSSPCKSFWGSTNATGNLIAWGPTIGWFLALTTAALLAIAVFSWWRGRPRPVVGAASVSTPGAGPAVPPAVTEGSGSSPPL